jgi:2-oxoisovalerate ferredoxin oxidoreductase beta subunit
MKTIERPDSILEVFPRKGGAEPDATHYCPGCGHGIIHKLMGECIDELGIKDDTVVISPVGCSVFAYYYFDTGNVQAAHGRAPAVGTGIKRARPKSVVISYQGDGDLAAIGGNNILQAANRGENMTVIFVNNAIYGMTGGQLAPTSLLGMRTATTPRGREFSEYGSPIRVAELLSQLDGVSFSARHSLTTPAKINKTKKAIKKALTYQMENKGFSIVEILAQCPTGWKMDPVDSLQWIEENMAPIFPLGTYKDAPHDRLTPPEPALYDPESVERVVRRRTGGEKEYRVLREAPWGAAFDGRGKDLDTITMKAAGFGGQGILLLGELVAKAGMLQGVNVTWLPSYGPEMRGGTANCSVVASTREIGNPMVTETDLLVAMNRPSLEKFQKEVRPGGVIFYDSSLISITPDRDDVAVHPVPATRIADGLGMGKVANVVMLGAVNKVLGFPEADRILETVKGISKNEKILQINQKAFQAGQEAI